MLNDMLPRTYRSVRCVGRHHRCHDVAVLRPLRALSGEDPVAEGSSTPFRWPVGFVQHLSFMAPNKETICSKQSAGSQRKQFPHWPVPPSRSVRKLLVKHRDLGSLLEWRQS